MAKEDTFLLMSLNEDKSKELAQVISNDTSRKILDYLSKHNDATESELAKELNLPLSTIHYNISHLKKAQLIESKEFVWSEKGKKIYYYRLAKKLIVIAPKSSENLLAQLKSILPIGIITLAVAGVIQFFSNFSNKMASSSRTFSELIPIVQPVEQVKDTVLEPVKENIAEEAMAGARDLGVGGVNEATKEIASKTTDTLPDQTVQVVNKTTEIITQTNNVTNEALWFLYGALFVIVLFALWKLFKNRKRLKKN